MKLNSLNLIIVVALFVHFAKSDVVCPGGIYVCPNNWTCCPGTSET